MKDHHLPALDRLACRLPVLVLLAAVQPKQGTAQHLLSDGVCSAFGFRASADLPPPGDFASPYVLTVASLIPLGISMGLAEEYFPTWKNYFKWFAAIGFLAIAITSIGGMDALKKIAVPLFHGVAGLVIFLGPFFAKGAPKGFCWVGIGGLLIGLGGIALAFISVGKQLLFFSPAFVMMILTPLLFLMTGAFALGFTRKG